jgi:TolB-like protein/Flp pilus assembly protein TadD
MPYRYSKLSQFWQELKRRRVIHVIIVYASAAFVILEAVDIIFPRLGFPDWTVTFVIILIAIGFPIAIIFSWIFDVTPGGIEKTKPAREIQKGEKVKVSNPWRIATYVSIVVIICFLVINIVGPRNHIKVDESLAKSIAVLPFLNLSGDPDQEYMCDGLTDEIINHLYKVASLDKVSPFSSVRKYKDPSIGISEIADELQVNYVLDGTYKRVGNQLRISANLIEPKSEKQVWQHDFDQPYKDIIAIPADIALQIANHLKAFLTDPEKQNIQKIPTSNQEAYDKYLLGNYYYRKGRFKSSMSSAINLYKESIALDPGFALAYTSLASSYLEYYWFRFDPSQYPIVESKKAIDAAFKIDTELPEAFIALGQYYYHGFLDYSNALEQLQIASGYMPDNAECKFLTACVYRRMGEWEKAIEEFEGAFECDPGSHSIIENLAQTYYMLGKYQEALNFFDKAIMIDPENVVSYESKIHIYLMRDGNTVQAREVLKEAALLNISEAALMKNSLYTNPLMLDVYDGNYQKALDFLSYADGEDQVNFISYHPKSLLQAMILDIMSLPEKANAYYDSARIQLEAMLLDNPEDPRYHSSLGIVYAGLGEKEKAISYGKEAVDLYSLNKDALFGLTRIEELAWIYVMVKEYDAALDQIEILISNPGPYSAPLLQLDPKWKPLWDHPEFIRLMEKYAKK